MNQGSGDPGKMGGLRRRRRTYSRTLPDHMKPNKQYGQDTEQHRDGNLGIRSVKEPGIRTSGCHYYRNTSSI